MKLSHLLLAITTGSSVPTSSSAGRVLNAFGEESYGVDVSFPVHYLNVQSKENNPLGDRQKFYDEFMKGCREHYGGKKGSAACDITEEDRLAMSLRQPKSMQVSSCCRDTYLSSLTTDYRLSDTHHASIRYTSCAYTFITTFRTTQTPALRRCQHPRKSSTFLLIIGRRIVTRENKRIGPKVTRTSITGRVQLTW